MVTSQLSDVRGFRSWSEITTTSQGEGVKKLLVRLDVGSPLFPHNSVELDHELLQNQLFAPPWAGGGQFSPTFFSGSFS